MAKYYPRLHRFLLSRLKLHMQSCESILHRFLPPVHRACLLVPELTLSVLTSSNPLWHVPYEEATSKLNRSDPWWAFLWPGSQALSRYLLDNRRLVRGRRVLDIGCGCGASAIAAKLTGALRVTANDIDEDALVATRHNARLNNVTIDQYSSENLLQDPVSFFSRETIDLLLMGDMCYDDQLADEVLKLIRTARQHQIQVLLADPGRYSFKTVVVNHLKETMKRVCEYPIVDRDYIESDFQTIQIWATSYS